MKNTLYGALLSAFPGGAFWLLFLFFVCFFGIHIVRLAKIGWQYRKGAPKPAPKAAPAKKTAAKPSAAGAGAADSASPARARLLHRGAQAQAPARDLFDTPRNPLQITRRVLCGRGLSLQEGILKKGQSVRPTQPCPRDIIENREMPSRKNAVKAADAGAPPFAASRRFRIHSAVIYPLRLPRSDRRTFRDCRRPPKAVRDDKRAWFRR